MPDVIRIFLLGLLAWAGVALIFGALALCAWASGLDVGTFLKSTLGGIGVAMAIALVVATTGQLIDGARYDKDEGSDRLR